MLGLTFPSKLVWSSYIISIAETASKKIGALIHSMKFFTPEVALYLYKSTISQCMEYCCYMPQLLYILYIVYRIYSNKRWASPLISAAPLNAALIRIVTIFYQKLNQNVYGTRIQTIKQNIVDIQIFYYMWFIDSENLFHFYFEIKKTRFSHLTLIIFVTLK